MDDDLLEAQKNLSDRDFQIFRDELRRHEKSKGVAYFLLLFLGMLGIHKYYIGKKDYGTAYLICFLIGLIPVCVLAWAVPFIGCIYDLFTLPRQMREQLSKEGRLILKRFDSKQKEEPLSSSENCE